MFVKNVSGVQQRIFSCSGEIRVNDGEIIQVPNSHFNRRNFIEVDANGQPKSAGYITENEKRTVAVDMEVVQSPAGEAQAKIVDEAKESPVQPSEDPKPTMINTTNSVFGAKRKAKL